VPAERALFAEGGGLLAGAPLSLLTEPLKGTRPALLVPPGLSGRKIDEEAEVFLAVPGDDPPAACRTGPPVEHPEGDRALLRDGGPLLQQEPALVAPGHV
jgi:hypothetical protein